MKYLKLLRKYVAYENYHMEVFSWLEASIGESFYQAVESARIWKPSVRSSET